VSASLSTHVLDTGSGRPAQGVRVELYQGDKLLATGKTDSDGRISKLYERLEPGPYRIVFHPVGPFFHRVELGIELGEDAHYHVPLLVSPYSCASYRGS
jgi:5-hydroxyisourate hydrolase